MHWTIAALCLALMWQAPSKTPPGKTTLKQLREMVYRLIWPAGRFDGDLTEVVARSTQKAGESPLSPAIYIVRTGRKNDMQEWKSARGALDAVFCEHGSLLVYRRGSELWTERIAVEERGLQPGTPTRITGIEVRRIYACVDEPSASSGILADDDAGTLRRIVLDGSAGSWSSLPAIVRQEHAEDLRDSLLVSRSIRPAGIAAWVAEGRVVTQTGASRPTLVASSPEVEFFGSPVWIGNRDLLLVMATPRTR